MNNPIITMSLGLIVGILIGIAIKLSKIIELLKILTNQ